LACLVFLSHLVELDDRLSNKTTKHAIVLIIENQGPHLENSPGRRQSYVHAWPFLLKQAVALAIATEGTSATTSLPSVAGIDGRGMCVLLDKGNQPLWVELAEKHLEYLALVVKEELADGSTQRKHARASADEPFESCVTGISQAYVRDCIRAVRKDSATTMDTFGKIVEASYAQALNIAALFCHSGYHRCDTSCRTLEGGLNAVVLDTGERVFNAQYFPTVHCNGAREVERVLDTALEWANCPWTYMPTITHEQYGMSAVRSRPEAQKAFSEIWDNVRRCEAWMSEEAAQAQHDRDEPEPPARKKRRRRSSPAETEDFIIFIWG
jgi:hypothetical protein